MRNIIAYLVESPIVEEVEVLELIEEPEIQLLYARVTLTNKTLLYIREVLTKSEDKYSYHWQDASGNLIRRWDNAPHWQKQVGSLHHIHIGKAELVQPSEKATVEDVIEVISNLVQK